ncbi:hypothetical protein VNO78_06171 [Psophocarpus tetragonolobus]|uniref:TIR domain-containing protein n=1 Tax=Psophocarpus tetragonolobus TaxID=3891 RepID=A0AAN9SRR2_PSOTE
MLPPILFLTLAFHIPDPIYCDLVSINCSFLPKKMKNSLFRKLTGGVAEEKPLSNNNSSPQTKYDVFVSFSGKNIRRGFLSHLIDSFERKKINAFVDDRLEKGEEIWPSLVEAIEGSLVSVVIFSPDYSSSRWCLAELVTILECKEKYGRRVIPVFYRVEPMNVRHQLGSYENAFAKHSSRHKTEVVDNWRHALKKAADLAGIVSSQFG